MSARLDEISAAVLARFAPPPRIDLATWVEDNVVLPKGMSDSPGPVRLYPYQRGICAAISDPEVERITVVKSARIGYTTLLSGMLASYVVNDPSQILLVLPTDGDCRDYVVNELEPIFAASPNLRGRLTDDTAGTGTKSRNTITSRRFEGGNFIAVGGHAPGNLRRRSARVLIVDEATAMLADKGEGDVVSRAVTRTQGFSDRKIIEGSTLTDDQSNVLLSWQRTNRQTFQVPCPRCGVYTFMQWCHLWWPPGRPEAAAFKCPHCDRVSPEAHKAEMVEAGQWIAEAPHVVGHVGFWINALVSPLAKAAWGRLAAEFLAVKGDAALLQPFVNNVMAEPWKGDIGDVDEVALLKKREPFGLAQRAQDGTPRPIPVDVLLIVVGTDVQDDRLECSVVGFSVEDAFVLDHVVIWGSPADDSTWRQHDALLNTKWVRSEIAEERRLTAAVKTEADHRHAALLSKEASLKEKLLAEDQKAENRRVAILAASESARVDHARREAVARSVIERSVTDKFKAEVKAREGASEGELATIKRVAVLEREARIRGIQAETAAIVAARHKQAEAEAEAVAHAQSKAGVGHLVTGTAAGYVSAHGMLRPAEAALEAGSERQGALIGARRAGMSPAEIVRAQDMAVKVARDVGNMTATQVLELHKEARSAVQHPEEVFELMPDLARAASALKGMGAQGNIADLVKAGESLGLMGNPERFRRFLDSQIRAQGVMGKTVTTEGTYEAAKYTKSAGATLSDEFLNLTLPSLIQELHGSSAGDAIASLTKRLRGGLAHQHLAVTQLQKMDLLEDPSQVHYAKGSGEIMGYTGKVKGDALLATDPDRWFNEVFKPAAQKNMGARTMADMNMLLSQTLGSTASNLGRIFIQQADTFAQHRENNRNAPGLDEQIQMQREDPKVAAQTFRDALDDLGAAVTGPVMGRVGLGMTDLADYIRNVEDAALAHPNVALGLGAGATAVGLAGSGWLAYQVSTGFGLPAAAGQLSASAVALETAAARIGAAGATGTAKDLAGAAAPGLGLASKLAIGVPLVGAGIFVTDAMVNRRDASKALIDGGRPDALTVNDDNLMLPGHADGGIITGRGGPRSDNIPIRVSPGEAVIPADVVRANLPLIQGLISRRSLLEGGEFRSGSLSRAEALGAPTTANGLTRVALATDSSSAAALREVVSQGMYDALRRIRNEGGLDGDGHGATGSGDGGGTPNMRYGRGSSGRYRGTPGTGQSYESGPHVSLGRMGAKFAEKAPVVMDGLMKKYGLTREQAAGVLGNLGHESGGFTQYHEGGQAPNKGGVGWAQWTGPRRRAFERWVAAHGLNPTSDEASWRYLTEGDPETPGAIAAVKRESTVGGSMRAFEAHFERAGVKAYGSRMRFANAAMGMRPGGATVATDASGAASTGTVPAGSDGIAGHVRGTLRIGDESFAYGSGGVRGSAHIPYGDYPINPDAPGAWGRAHNAMAVNNDGSIWDASLGRMRTGIEMHVAHSANMVTEGCMSFLKDQYPTLKQRVREMVAKTGHAYLHVGPDGASITPEAQRAAERAVLPQRPPVGASAAPQASIGLDHSPILAAIEHVDTLHRKLQGLKGVASVDVNHRHRHEGELGAAGRPGALRTSLNGHYASDGRSWT